METPIIKNNIQLYRIMEINLKNRSFLTLLDFTAEEIQYLISLALKLKRLSRMDSKNKCSAEKTLP
jgi:ornithine carbamoyltransferase